MSSPFKFVLRVGATAIRVIRVVHVGTVEGPVTRKIAVGTILTAVPSRVEITIGGIVTELATTCGRNIIMGMVETVEVMLGAKIVGERIVTVMTVDETTDAVLGPGLPVIQTPNRTSRERGSIRPSTASLSLKQSLSIYLEARSSRSPGTRRST